MPDAAGARGGVEAAAAEQQAFRRLDAKSVALIEAYYMAVQDAATAASVPSAS